LRRRRPRPRARSSSRRFCAMSDDEKTRWATDVTTAWTHDGCADFLRDRVDTYLAEPDGCPGLITGLIDLSGLLLMGMEATTARDGCDTRTRSRRRGRGAGNLRAASGRDRRSPWVLTHLRSSWHRFTLRLFLCGAGRWSTHPAWSTGEYFLASPLNLIWLPVTSAMSGQRAKKVPRCRQRSRAASGRGRVAWRRS
jgi:hypothetical protein